MDRGYLQHSYLDVSDGYVDGLELAPVVAPVLPRKLVRQRGPGGTAQYHLSGAARQHTRPLVQVTDEG